MIKHWHILIRGFTQCDARPSGFEHLWLQLRNRSNPDTAILLVNWNADFADLASLISRCSTEGAGVNIYAYSWGAGRGFPMLACELHRHGMTVATACLCDPVYRDPGLPAWLPDLRAMLPDQKIVVPSNVAEVHWCYQRRNHPTGHTPVRSPDASTVIHPGRELFIHHEQMDDAPEFYEIALRAAEQLA
jgi:hypothetical protein